MVVGVELREPIRSHHDIERDNVKYFKRASKVRTPVLYIDQHPLTRPRSSTNPLLAVQLRTDTPSTSSLDASTKSVSSR
jgi:hypothetical protein